MLASIRHIAWRKRLFKMYMSGGPPRICCRYSLACEAFNTGLSASSLLQVLVLVLCATIFTCFVYELAAVKPVWLDVAKGFIPTPEILTNTSMLYTAIGIVGETLTPQRLQDRANKALSISVLQHGLLCSRAG